MNTRLHSEDNEQPENLEEPQEVEVYACCVVVTPMVD